MTMSLLAPLFLFGLALLALPVWLHRLQTQSSDRKPFSSAMLLQTTEQQVHVRKKLKFLMLLGLRIALLLLIALIFAKPLWTRPDALPGLGPDGTHLIVLDTSASMQRKGAFEQALGLARRALDVVPAGALLQVFAADDALRAATELLPRQATHTAALAEIRPDARRLDFGHMIAAVDSYAESLPQPVTLHLISDFQDSAMPPRFADLASTHIASFIPWAVGSGQPFNWKVEFVRETAGGVDVGVFGSGPAERAGAVEIDLNGKIVDHRGVTATGPSVLTFSSLPVESGDNRLQVRIESDDDLSIDNENFYVIENQPPAPIPLLTLNPGGLPVTYLTTALQADPDGAYVVEPKLIGEFDLRTLSRYRWLLIDDIGAISSEVETALMEFLSNGGNILAFAGQRSTTMSRIPVSGNAIRPASLASSVDQFLSVGQVDNSHPMLAGTNGWYSVNVSQTVPIDDGLDDQVLIRLENGEPFLIERELGSGRMLLLAGGLENQGNDLPIRPVFVSFMIEAARYLAGGDRISRSYATGATLPLSLAGGVSGQVIDPDGNTILSLADTTRAQQIKLNKPGFYEVYTSQGDYVVAVNTDARESDLAPIDASVLERWVAAMAGAAAISNNATGGTHADPLELWPALLFILALLLIGESLLGNAYLAPRSAN